MPAALAGGARKLCFSLLIAPAALFAVPAGAIAPLSSDTAKLFEQPPELARDVQFWIRVYTEVTTDQGLLHDDWNLGVVYEVLKFDAEVPASERAHRVEQAKMHYRALLARFAAGDTANLSDDEQRIFKAFGEHPSAVQFKAAQDDIRFQLGQANRFREGLMRAGIWESHIARTLSQRGVPAEIAALPHVESSFNPDAYSRVGAAGLWQFMPSTARRFMRVDGLVDERLDPFTATEGAANLMMYNYHLLGSWPLAITAYNHGPGGLLRAQNELGTSNIATIVRHYNGATFGFASRNFYVAFLAALDVDRNAEKYFGPIPKQPDAESTTLELPDYIPIGALVSAFKVDRGALRALNSALRPPIWDNRRFVPRGYALRLPGSVSEDELKSALARVPGNQRFLAQRNDETYRARRGDTLIRIAQAQGLPLDRLLAVNGWTANRAIKRGQVLRLPLPGTRAGAPLSNAALLAAARQSGLGEDEAPKEVVVPEPATARVAATPSPPPAAAIPNVTPPGTIQSSAASSAAPPLLAARQGPHHPLTRAGLKLPPSTPMVMQPAPPVVGKVSPPPPAAPTPPAAPATPASPAAVAPVVASSGGTFEPLPDEHNPPPKPIAEPVTERQADVSALLPGAVASNNADPADYSVGRDQQIIVQADETLGHYADWGGVTASQLRRLNRLKKGSFVSIGHKVKVDVSKVGAAQFEAVRREYHKNLQDTYFATHRISGGENYAIKRGESLWTIAQQQGELPIWLLRQYNPRIDFADVRPGTVISLPKVEAANRD